MFGANDMLYQCYNYLSYIFTSTPLLYFHHHSQYNYVYFGTGTLYIQQSARLTHYFKRYFLFQREHTQIKLYIFSYLKSPFCVF